MFSIKASKERLLVLDKLELGQIRTKLSSWVFQGIIRQIK
jgi:hypothetical protein